MFVYYVNMQIRPVIPQYSNSYVQRAQIPRCGDEVSFGINYSKLDGLTYNKYKSLSFFDKLKFRLLTPLSIKRDSCANYYAARKARHYLDNMFGADSYTLMVIGRSMATVGETMGLLGRDVRLLPMSGLSDGLPKNIEHVEVYKKFLNSIGLSKKFIEDNPDRHFIVVDYVSSGESLNNAHEFLSRPDLLGNPERLEKFSANELLQPNRILNATLELLYLLSEFKRFSPVKRLELTELDKTFERLQPDPKYKNERNMFLLDIMLQGRKIYKKDR